MRRLRIGLNLILLAAPLLFLITGGVRLVRGVFAYLNSNQRLAGTMSAEATHALGREVRVRDVYITGNLWSLDAANRIDLFDVAVANGPVLADGAIATSRRVAVWYNLRQVLANSDVRAPIVDELRLDGPEMLVARSASGHWNYQDLLPKHAEINRPFTSKITVTGGTVQYADNAFPHPPGVAERPLDARISSVHGIVLIRPDKSAAFTISGVAPPAYLRDFTATGTFVPFPLHVQARVLASQVVLPEMARRLAPAAQLSVSRGAADLDVGLVYIPSPNTSPRVFDTRALTAHGTAKIYDASATGKFLYAAVDHLNGAAVFTNDSLQGSGTATYDGMPVQVAGAALGLSFPQRGPQATVPLAPVTVSLHGTVQHVDWPRVRQLGFVPSILARLPQRVRQDMAAATLDGDLAFQIAGPVNSLESTVSGTVHHVAYAGYRGDAVDLRAAIGNGVARASVKGRYAGGDAILRGMVELNDGGRFEASAQGRNLDLARLGIPVGPKLTGTGQLDFAIRGRRNFTPNISTQAEVFDATVNGQEIRHAFARADTVGPDLVIRTLAADDPKGFVTATGTIGMKTRRLNLLVDADDLNFSSIARAFVPKLSAANVSKLSKTPADRALARLAGAQGYGYARTRVTGTIDSPRMDGKVYAFGVQVGDYDLDKVTVSDLSVTKDNLHIDAIASRYPGQVHLAGDILRPFSQTPELMLEGSATDLDLSALTRLAGFDRKDLALTGTLSTTNIPIRGTLSSPQTPDFFTANLQNA
ncbi:MAG TPA: DUF748 domain-containing protein, partial [Chthonomonadaceae bacterium]|nr:DUF748 domain-containing protein [Chthonomonadaceae bacterium]